MEVAAAAPTAVPRQHLICAAKRAPSGHPMRLLSSSAVCQVVLMAHRRDPPRVVKTLLPSLAGHPGARYLLDRERRVLERLQGPGVVALGAQASGSIAMEYLPGGDFVALVGAPDDRWLASLATLARGLDRIHRLGWVHRDVRPENAVFRSADTPVWIDFQAAAETSGEWHGLSRGTLPYASPEQYAGLPPSPRDDVYSFGIMLYQLATSRLPDEALPLTGTQGWDALAAPLRCWARAALAPTRAGRPAGVSELADILAALADRNDGDEYTDN
jgi:serine/threonine protein kinase